MTFTALNTSIYYRLQDASHPIIVQDFHCRVPNRTRRLCDIVRHSSQAFAIGSIAVCIEQDSIEEDSYTAPVRSSELPDNTHGQWSPIARGQLVVWVYTNVYISWYQFIPMNILVPSQDGPRQNQPYASTYLVRGLLFNSRTQDYLVIPCKTRIAVSSSVRLDNAWPLVNDCLGFKHQHKTIIITSWYWRIYVYQYQVKMD